MTKFLTVGGPSAGVPEGVFPDTVTARFYNRSGGAYLIGEHVQLDLAAVAAEVTSIVPGEANTVWNSVIEPVSSTTLAGTHAGIHAVALAAVAQDESGEFLLRGIVNAKVDGATAEGSLLVAATDGTLDLASNTAFKIIAISLMVDAPTGFADVWFDGIDGFGPAVDA